MAKIEGRPQLNCEIVLVISESEARALDALAGYGDDAFIKNFYTHLGESYMKPHEAGLRQFLKTLRDASGLGSVLSRMDDARSVWEGIKVARNAEIVKRGDNA
jgi:hypothetical protein